MILISSGPLRNIKCYAIWVEFYVRGSPHIQSFWWVLNSPNIEDNIDIHNIFVDSDRYFLHLQIFHLKQTILCFLSLCKHIKFTDILSRAKIQSCRFNFGKFFTILVKLSDFQFWKKWKVFFQKFLNTLMNI